MTKIQQGLSPREIFVNDDSKAEPSYKKFVDSLSEKAKKECNTYYIRLVYRSKYNLPPNDPRFLEMTDEEILYDLLLMSEFHKKLKENEQDEDTEIFKSDEKDFEDISNMLEEGIDFDLEDLTKKDEWDKI